MSLPRTAVVALAVVALVAALAIGDRPTPPAHDPHALRSPSIDVEAVVPVAIGSSRSTDRSPTPASDLTLRVSDEHGEPLHGVAVFAVDSLLRQLDPDAAIARTDRGVALLPVSVARDRSHLVAAMPGFESGAIALDATTAHYELVLRRGDRAGFRAVDEAGAPVRDLPIAVSMACFGEVPAATAGGPWLAGPTRYAVFRGATDAAGELVLDGLQPGRHAWRVESFDHVAIGGPDDGEIEIPGATVRLVVAPLHGVIADVGAGRVLATDTRWQPRNPFRVEPPCAQPGITRARLELRERFPQCLSIVGLLAAHEDIEREPVTAEVTALLDSGQWVRVTAPIERLAGTAPRRAAIVPLDTPIGACRVSVRNPSDGSVIRTQVSLETRSPAGGRVIVAVASGADAALPAGDYAIRARSLPVAFRGETAFRIEPGSTTLHEIVLAHDCVEVEVRIATTDAIAPSYASVHVDAGGFRRYFGTHDGSLRWLLPRTIADFRVSAFGTTGVARQVDLAQMRELHFVLDYAQQR